jgi:hypothetical protein
MSIVYVFVENFLNLSDLLDFFGFSEFVALGSYDTSCCAILVVNSTVDSLILYGL